MALVPMERGRGDRQCEAEKIEVLACVSDAVRTAEPHGVVEVTVDGFGVVAAGKQLFEVGIAGCDGPEVFGPVQLPRRILVVAVQPDGEGLVFVIGGKLAVVVPAVAGVAAANTGRVRKSRDGRA
jgi:hypothetical protein